MATALLVCWGLLDTAWAKDPPAKPSAGTGPFAVDVYVAVTPSKDDPGQFTVYYTARKSVRVTQDQLGKDGVLKVEPKSFTGAKQLTKDIRGAFTGVNKTYEGSSAQFTVRNVYVIRADQEDLKPHLKSEDEQVSLGISDGKSKLLSAFDAATASNKGAFKVLMADLSDDAGERGRAQKGGNVSVVHIAPAMDTRNNGHILSHELGHNLGLDDVSGQDPFTRVMAVGGA